ncbi:MAG: 50S ribosomal protein L3 [Patescibacteria group bacterium]|nr:50S ribosomal protein L3 [Patescibacteria group bacterium]MCX7589903.1 50S ribosomal protein L3 [Patescibacteria group bacterium]MDW8279583.1 50S ribosomal protein L3 [bacterium]
MKMFILGKKIKMTQIWKDGKVFPVTVIEAKPNKVEYFRTKEKDKYESICLNLNNHKKEFRLDKLTDEEKDMLKNKKVIDLSFFKEGEKVIVSSISKGKGFTGVVKRHGFGGGPRTHGQKNRWRAPGSIGPTAPQHIFKGRKMAGRAGNQRITIKNIEVVSVDTQNNILMLKGGVAGSRNALIEIRKK